MKEMIRMPAAKAVSFVLSVLGILLSVIGFLGAALCTECGFYSGQESASGLVDRAYRSEIGSIVEMCADQRSDALFSRYDPSATSLRYEILLDGGESCSNRSDGEVISGETVYYVSYVMSDKKRLVDYTYSSVSDTLQTDWDYAGENADGENEYSVHSMTVRMGISASGAVHDSYAFFLSLLNTAKSLRFAFIWFATAGMILFILANAALLAGAGRKPGTEEVVSGWQEKIPFDLYLVLFGGGALLSFTGFVFFVLETFSPSDSLYLAMILGALALAGGALLSEMMIASAAVRIKAGKWWRNTLIYRILHRFYKLLEKIFGGVFGSAHSFFANLPFVWQGVAVVCAVLFGEFFLTLLMVSGGFFWGLLWLLYNVAAVLAAGTIILQLRRLREGAKAMAEGNLDFHIDTDGMPGILKSHGVDLNAIGEGMAKAVDQKMRSERMKTELITNVSHDIKTPLTSIVNYVDLLSKEAPENERMKEYIEALSRQSRRLRKLIEDLVEASKASTGNLSVDLQPCELGVLIEQTAGEYQERLEKCGLSLVVEAPDTPVRVMADSRRIWRVLDNLMGNICKYALSGTRVYITLEKGERARLTLRNISRDRLGVSPEELTERFVRGDSSRSTEGSGLGLSIAKSLMELQGGTLTLKIDGDLFKAIVELPLIGEEPDSNQPEE